MATPEKAAPIKRKDKQGHHHGSGTQCHKKHQPAKKS